MTANDWWMAGLFWITAIAAGVSITTAVLLEPEDIRPATAEVCDDAVRTLLKTKDLVELERSKFLIHKLSCRISRRLEAPP
jgi:hypothetical protein